MHKTSLISNNNNNNNSSAKKSDLSVNPPKLKIRRSEASKNSKTTSEGKLKKLSDSPSTFKVKEETETTGKQPKVSKVSEINLRKRRRSARFEDDLTADTCSTISNGESSANMGDFEDEPFVGSKSDLRDDMTNESSATNNDNNEANRPKKYRKYIKGRKSSTNARQTKNNSAGDLDTAQNKKVHSTYATSDALSSSLAEADPLQLALTGELKSEAEIKIECDFSPTKVAPPQRRQKALKQTNVKSIDMISKYQRRFKRFLDKSKSTDENTEYGYLSAPKSPEIISTTLAGNVKFCANKNNFKCVECGNTDLKTHFKNDYTCHQCKYNTNCSNSFEYHLHGHLVSKRVAMWNKVLKTPTEDYRCQCGFSLNSTTDNACNANTGNKVAEHMMKCEYKYCSVFIEEEPRINAVKVENDEKSSVEENVHRFRLETEQASEYAY